MPEVRRDRLGKEGVGGRICILPVPYEIGKAQGKGKDFIGLQRKNLSAEFGSSFRSTPKYNQR
jgi:hypothetical protein